MDNQVLATIDMNGKTYIISQPLHPEITAKLYRRPAHSFSIGFYYEEHMFYFVTAKPGLRPELMIEWDVILKALRSIPDLALSINSTISGTPFDHPVYVPNVADIRSIEEYRKISPVKFADEIPVTSVDHMTRLRDFYHDCFRGNIFVAKTKKEERALEKWVDHHYYFLMKLFVENYRKPCVLQRNSVLVPMEDVLESIDKFPVDKRVVIRKRNRDE